MHTLVRGAVTALVTLVAAFAAAPSSAYAADSSSAGTITPQATWFTGTISPGASLNQKWNNTNPSLAYLVGLNPQGAGTTTPCQMEVTRTWYVQQPGGEVEFWFTIKNIGTLACSTEILLTWLPNIAGAWSTGGVDPGASMTKHWNNANPLTNSYVAGLSPVGATGTTACQFEVTREWYAQQPGGEREFWFTIKNVGTIACSTNILLGTKASTKITTTGTLAAGASISKSWNNANPLNAAHIVGLSPLGATSTACQLEVTRTWYRQVINPPAERELRYTVKNVGSISCSADVLLALNTA